MVWVLISKMKKWVFCLLLIVISSFATEAIGQTYTQTYKDKCTGEIKVATTTMTNGFATVSFYNQVRVFSPQEVIKMDTPFTDNCYVFIRKR